MSVRLRLSTNLIAPLAVVLAISVAADAAPFTPGNVVVYRVGDGTGNLTNKGHAVFLDEYSATGSLVQSIAIPTTGSDRLVASGREPNEGQMTFTTNGRYLLLTGYDDSPNGPTNLKASSASEINRVIGRVDMTTGFYERTNALNDVARQNGGAPTGIASDDGTRFWVGGTTGGLRFVDSIGATTSTKLSPAPGDVRQVGIFDGQLYATTVGTNGLRVATIGTGLPTTAGQTVSNLPNVPTTGTPSGFYLADLDAGVAGVDTLYVAYEGNKAVSKYSLVGGDWMLNGSIGTSADEFRGLTAVTIGSSVTLFATRNSGTTATGGGSLVTLSDTSGYNGAFTGSFTQIAAAGNQTAFRGVAYIAAVPEPSLLLLLASVGTLGGINWFVGRKRRG